MARPKGSKNKKTVEAVSTDQIKEAITAAEEKLMDLTEQTKATRAEIKALKKQLADAEAAEAAAKAEADRERIMEAVKNSGKSVDEILELIGK